jgi:hypothetical protein
MVRRFLLPLALAAFMAARPAPACDTTVQVANASGLQVDQIYFSPSSQEEWGPDRLGAQVLPAGSSVVYRPERGGRFDFKVVWSGGREAEIRGVDVCAVRRIKVTRSGLSAER